MAQGWHSASVPFRVIQHILDVHSFVNELVSSSIDFVWYIHVDSKWWMYFRYSRTGLGVDSVWITFIYRRQTGNDRITSSFIQNNSEPGVKVVRAEIFMQLEHCNALKIVYQCTELWFVCFVHYSLSQSSLWPSSSLTRSGRGALWCLVWSSTTIVPLNVQLKGWSSSSSLCSRCGWRHHHHWSMLLSLCVDGAREWLKTFLCFDQFWCAAHNTHIINQTPRINRTTGKSETERYCVIISNFSEISKWKYKRRKWQAAVVATSSSV